MFSADLSWSDHRAETVGQHRERRRQRSRDHAPSALSSHSDESVSKSSFWSLPNRRKNNPPPKPSAQSSPANNSSNGNNNNTTARRPPLHSRSHSRPREPSLDSVAGWSPSSFRPPSPVLQNTSFLSSVDSLDDLQAYDIRHLHGDPYAARTKSSSTEASSSSSIRGRLRSSFSSRYAPEHRTASSSSHHASPDCGPSCAWEAAPDWDSASVRSVSRAGQSFESSPLYAPEATELTQFQRFIRRMEHADPKLILARLQNDPCPDDLVTDPYAQEEQAVEKHLWCLAALQLQNMENSLIPNQGVGPLLGLPTLFRQPKRVLELYSNLAEVYQLSAVYPKSQISYLTVRKPLASIPLPANIRPLTVPTAGVLPFPYPTDSFNHIRCAALPSHAPSPKVQPVLRDLHRMLTPGGILELRLVDSTPVRATMGPKLRAWFEDHLLLNLEQQFLCSRPLALFPGWVRQSGLRILGGGDRAGDLVMQRLRLPACVSPRNSKSRNAALRSAQAAGLQNDSKGSSSKHGKQRAAVGLGTETLDFAATDNPTTAEADAAALDGELATLVARGLWKDCWGSLVDRSSSLGDDIIWWWDDPEIVRECWDYGTIFECGTLFAFKE